jgi:hypothetical protein
MNAEFQWWLLILGMVIGGALVYLVLADLRRDEATAGESLGDEPEPTESAAGPEPTEPAAEPGAEP